MTDLSPAISVRGLTARYGEHIALSGVSLEVMPGERVAVVGSSGSGKTSLLRVLGGLIAPASGEVIVAGHAVSGPTSLSREAFRDIGVVFQDYGLVRQLTPMQNALCGRLSHYPARGAFTSFSARDVEDARAALTSLGLGDRLELPSKKLSGGEQQRVALARLLLQAPRVMLLDEPIASLDVHWARAAMDALATCRPDAAIVCVLHDLEVTRAWATRVMVICDGAIIFDGAPDEGVSLLRDGPDEATDAATTAQLDAPPAPPANQRQPWQLVGLAVAAVALYAWAFAGIGVDSSKVFGSVKYGADFLRRTFPPDVSVTPTILRSILETIQMSLLGTTAAVICGLPIAMMAARNVSPLPLRICARFLLNFMRTIPSIIWGLFFVAVVGLGPFPGVLALGCYATGYLGKFYYEAIEAIDPRPLVALRVTGASRVQRFRYGVFPQVFPVLTGHTLYMLEYNTRAASVLGVVGAGGVGFYLYNYINNFQYPKAMTALVFLLLLVTALDMVSGRLREWMQDEG